ncbi:MAG: PEP-CTERM sorting domain-containing protein, partial [Oceanipulchritudo sp.]
FDWIPLYLWDADDQIDFRLFTTSDNSTSGTISEIYVSAVTGHAQGDGYQTDLDLTGIGTVQAGNIGQDLWIEFWSSTAAGVEDVSTGEFARVDDVRLTAVPEPATYVLLGGLAALALVMVRRRLRA